MLGDGHPHLTQGNNSTRKINTLHVRRRYQRRHSKFGIEFMEKVALKFNIVALVTGCLKLGALLPLVFKWKMHIACN